MASGRLGTALRDLRRLLDDGVVAGLADEELLERFASRRDGEAFEALVARHGPMVLVTCRGVLGDEHAAEDAFQATFLTLARKARSLRSGRALAGWLHLVARRIAVQASADIARRRREAWSPAVDLAVAPRGSPSADSGRLLHEEVDRLPERYRVPIVLCYFEGMTHEQAAGHLRCPVGTVGSRVVRARDLMRARLLRRGVTGAALVILSSPEKAPAAVPVACVRAAVAAATRGVASARVSVLSRTIMKGMLMSKLKIAGTALLAAGSLLSAGMVADLGRLDPGGIAAATPETAPVAPEVPQGKPISPSPDVEVIIGGRVLDPAGRPVAGAAIRVDYFLPETPEGPPPTATSGPDGRFSLRAPRAAFEGFSRGSGKRPPRVVAGAPGFGPAWAVPGSRSDSSRDVTLRLAPDDLPIEGRVVDLEGRPIAGVEIRTSTAWEASGADLSAWIEGAKDRGQTVWQGLESMPLELVRKTGADGRFRLNGVGRERVVDLKVSGPTIETSTAYAMTKVFPSFRAETRGGMDAEATTYHGSRFDHAAAPTRPIVGVVRDKDTGKALAGVRINGMVFAEGSLVTKDGIEAVTDDEGRYRLLGLPRAIRYRVLAFPADGQPYPNATVTAEAKTLALDPVGCDIAIKRGVLIRGRVTDKATGEPVVAWVESFTFEDNPRLADFPGYRSSYPPRGQTKGDGRFAVVALPGRGLIAVRAQADRYLQGLGVEGIAGFDGRFFLTSPHQCIPADYQFIAEVSPDPASGEMTRDIQLDPGRTLKGTARDPEDRPIAGTVGSGLAAIGFWGDRPLESADFEVTGLDPRRPRRLVLSHEGRKLVGSALLLGNEVGPLIVRLQPWGVVTGRVVDEEGLPRTKLELMSTAPPAFDPDRGFLRRRFPLDGEGRFRVDGLVPGLIHEAYALERNIQIIGKVFGDLRVGPGESKDLGDVVIKKRDAD